jgi:hypothetical protein
MHRLISSLMNWKGVNDMGAVAIDINANERKLEVMFPMDSREGIETFLENINYLHELMFFSGDYDALILLIDFQNAVVNCGLSEKELKTIHLVFIEDMKRVDVAKQFGVTKQTIQKFLERAFDKLANYYKEVEGVENV